MQYLLFFKSKTFQYILLGIALIGLGVYLYSEFKTAITNNTILRQNNLKLEEKNRVLKSNLKAKEEQLKEALKVKEFNTKAEVKKEEVQNKINEFKKDNRDEKDETIYNKPTYFML